MLATPNSRSKGVFFRRRCISAVNPPSSDDHRVVLCEQAQNAREPISSALTLLASSQFDRLRYRLIGRNIQLRLTLIVGADAIPFGRCNIGG
jgi:hypothetical protein